LRRFTQLFIEMDRTTRSSERLAAMVRYFHSAPPQDAAWGLFFLSGRKVKRLPNWRVLDDAIRSETDLPDWLVGSSYEAVGDGAEMMALLYPHEPKDHDGVNESLSELVEKRLLPLRTMADPARQRDAIRASWSVMTRDQRLVFNKLLTGAFRVGVAQTSIIKALAEVANVSPAVMSHRFAGDWEPTAPRFTALIDGTVEGNGTGTTSQAAGGASSAQPYPFFLGYPLEGDVADLGEIAQWQVEWKYDGIRAQVIHRAGLSSPIVWSRGEELIAPAFPEIVEAAAVLPQGTVLDGEIAAWENERALPFAMLQRRINRKQVEAALWVDVPVAFIAFDVLEFAGKDVREKPLRERRAILEALITALPNVGAGPAMRASPLVTFSSWDELARLRLESRQRSVEGVMLKRLDSVYAVGRKKGDWWKWKIDPYTVDAVLIYAQGGSGRRSGLFTDYTFGVWDESGVSTSNVGGRELVPVAKAYSGLTDDEIKQVDRFIKQNTLSKHGSVRVVKPELVFELAFEGIQESDRHKAKLALRFPRMHRWRTDKKAEEADTLETLRLLLRAHVRGGSIDHGDHGGHGEREKAKR
jgi:DNA ligase-1